MNRSPVSRAERERRIAPVLAAQHGQAHVRDLLAAGFSRPTITREVRTHRFFRTGRCVYSVVERPTHAGRLVVATLATARDAAITGACAAHHAGVLKRRCPPITVTSSTARRACSADHLLATRWLPPEHVEVRDGVRSTTTSRMIVDLAETATAHQVANVMHEAEFRRQLDVAQILGISEVLKQRHGTRVLRRAIQLHRSGSAGTMSASEDEALRLELAAGIPEPTVNPLVAGRITRYRCDQYFDDLLLNVEIDGRHDRSRCVVSDAERDADLASVGILVVRVHASVVWNEPREFIRIVLQARRDAAARLGR